MLEILGGLLLVTGSIFLLLGGLGLVRMPDVFNRIQAGTKATTLGTMLTLMGFACLQPDWVLKLFLIGLFVLFTNPLSSQVLARAAHRSGVRMTRRTTVDTLNEQESPQ
jgi:multicomponent Na+:H+ antiporter subunit G